MKLKKSEATRRLRELDAIGALPLIEQLVGGWSPEDPDPPAVFCITLPSYLGTEHFLLTPSLEWLFKRVDSRLVAEEVQWGPREADSYIGPFLDEIARLHALRGLEDKIQDQPTGFVIFEETD